MPENKEHCEATFKIYGVTGRDIHEWMDAPVKILGYGHRDFRHSPDIEIPKIFIDKYGEELARNIIIDHIILDQEKKTTDKKNYKSVYGIQLKESVNYTIYKRIVRAKNTIEKIIELDLLPEEVKIKPEIEMDQDPKYFEVRKLYAEYLGVNNE